MTMNIQYLEMQDSVEARTNGICYFMLYSFILIYRTPLRRKYQLERTKSKLARDETNIHPLLPNKQRILILNSNSKDAATNAGKETISDPLSMLAMKDPLSAMLDDPLSVIDDPLRSPAFMSNQKPSGHIYTTGKSAITEEGDEKDTNSLASQWNLKKLQIAKDYAMTGTIMGPMKHSHYFVETFAHLICVMLFVLI